MVSMITYDGLFACMFAPCQGEVYSVGSTSTWWDAGQDRAAVLRLALAM